jgi:Right handed beta helix region
MKFRNLLLTIVSLCCCANTLAAIYYVDAKNGNDKWTGTVSTASSTNGPWQSIAKVNATTLKPGDQVLFSCGQSWYETLNPISSGSSAAKINFGSYPSQCTNKPKITGLQQIPSNTWKTYQGNIWKTTFPQNLIINNNIISSVSNWLKYPSDAVQTFNSTCPISVAGCMNFHAGTSQGSSIAISNQFPIIGGKKYTVFVSFYATSDTSVGVMVRENGPKTYRTLGLEKWGITGDSSKWKDLSFQFTATRTITNARLDIQIPKAKQIFIRYASIVRDENQLQPSMVLFDGAPVNIAHHPNQGHDINKPNSEYLLTSAASPVIKDSSGRSVSPAIIVPDLKLPAGATISASTKLKLRHLDWEISDFSVTSINNNILSVTPNIKYPLTHAGWGFYFYDALWMLDSAGEWFFNYSTQTLYLWAPTGKFPANSVSISSMDMGLDLRAKSNIVVDNLEINGVTVGIDISKSQLITLKNLNIINVKSDAIFAQNSITPTITNNNIYRAGKIAIDAEFSSNAHINSNKINEVGVFVKAGKRISLPTFTSSALRGGSGSIIQDNLLADIGRMGIVGGNDNDISYNVIRRSCFTHNDCGAIYLYSASLRSLIDNNLILDVLSDLNGTPYAKTVSGIYLDGGISGLTVSGNTIKGSTSSVLFHNSNNINLTNNIFYGSEGRMLFQQEDTYVKSVLKENTVSNNQFFPTIDNPVIDNTTKVGDITKFATYSKNHYSTIHSTYIVSEKDYVKGQSNLYTLQDWKNATINGLARNNDLESKLSAPLTSFASGTVGSNLMSNSDFSSGLKGWGYFNIDAPKARGTVEGCLPVSVNCLHVITGAPKTLIHSPSFAITKGKRYRVTFDMKSTVTNGVFSPRPRFAGPTKYGSVTANHLPYPMPFSADWTRYSFIFEAAVTAANPTLNDQGARFDLDGLPNGQNIWVANLEIVSFDPGVFGTPQSDLLVNDTEIDKSIDCPTRSTNPSLCSNFVRFPEGVAAVWPVSVPPRSGRIVFTQNLSLLDSDGDGISDSQDQCKNTVQGLSVNRSGCSLTD